MGLRISHHAVDRARALDPRVEWFDLHRWWADGESVDPGLVQAITQRSTPDAADTYRAVRGLPGLMVGRESTNHDGDPVTVLVTVLRLTPTQAGFVPACTPPAAPAAPAPVSITPPPGAFGLAPAGGSAYKGKVGDRAVTARKTGEGATATWTVSICEPGATNPALSVKDVSAERATAIARLYLEGGAGT